MSFNPIRKTGDHKAENFNDRIFSWWRTLNNWSWHAKSSYTSRSVLYVAHHFVALLIFFCYFSAHFLPHKSQLFISYFSVLQTSLFHAAADAITGECTFSMLPCWWHTEYFHYITKVSSLWVRSERKESEEREKGNYNFLFYFFCYHKRKLKEESKSLKLFLVRFAKLFCWLKEISCVNCYAIKRHEQGAWKWHWL